MILLAGPASPYVRIVRVQIELCGLQDQVEVRMVATRVPDSPVHQHNPTGKIPTLVVDEHHAIGEARLICEHLDGCHAGTPFAPTSQTLAARSFEGLAVGFLDGMAVWIREARRPGNEQAPSILEQEEARALRCIEYLSANSSWQDEPLDYARTCIAITLWRMRYSLPDFDWPAQFPQLAYWHEAFMAQPVVQRTGPPQT